MSDGTLPPDPSSGTAPRLGTHESGGTFPESVVTKQVAYLEKVISDAMLGANAVVTDDGRQILATAAARAVADDVAEFVNHWFNGTVIAALEQVDALKRERDDALLEAQTARYTLDGFRDGLTKALNDHGVPAMPSWPAAIDYLAEHGGRTDA